MKTIGQIIKDARLKKGYPLQYLENETKIKSTFIGWIEEQKWEKLPSFPTVLGFVKSISDVLEIDENMATAVLKRDYPPRKLTIAPKPDVASKFSWNPKLTFIVAIAFVTLAAAAYLGFQYYRFISPPTLKVDSPTEGQVVSDGSVMVFGTTDSGAKVTVDNQPVIIDDSGHFSVDISVSSDTKEVTIIATNRSGKATTISRTIKVQ